MLKLLLLKLAENYARLRGLSVSRVSTLVFSDGKVLARLSNGGDITTGRFESAIDWFGTHWPEGHVWPSDVPKKVSEMVSPAGSSAGEAGASSPNSGTPAVCQGRADVARLAHNQEVAGSNPAPATSLHDELCHPSTAMQVNGNPSPTSGAMDLVEVGTGQISAVLPQESHKAASFNSSDTSSQSDGNAGAQHSLAGCAPAAVLGEVAE